MQKQATTATVAPKARKLNRVAKPAKPAIANVKPAVETAPAVPDTTANKPTRSFARDVSTISAMRAHFGAVSSRDDAYTLFLAATFGSKPEEGDTVTLSQLAQAHIVGGKSVNPFYNGSNKATDAGAIQRLIKAGTVTPSGDTGETLTFTARGAELAANRLAHYSNTKA